MRRSCDTLVLGSGIAGLTYALRMAEHGTVAILTKRELTTSNTRWAQGGIAAVMDPEDRVEDHVRDTVQVGGGLSDETIVRTCVEEGPERIRELLALGVDFTRRANGGEASGEAPLDLGREGGHSARRIVHAKDTTGAAVEDALARAVAEHPNVEVHEHHQAVDLITTRRLMPQGRGNPAPQPTGEGGAGPPRCLGAYVMDVRDGRIHTFLAHAVLLATGGSGKVYLYTSNPDVATGDGIAMAWRAGARVANMEFFQFHPTCLYHPAAKNFLISEACRGEGGVLRRLDGTAFMASYHADADLAPRDVVARAIDSELKRSGDEHVYLDLSHLPDGFVEQRFPAILEELERWGIDARREPVPVVPAAHYCCGGVVVDAWGRSTLPGLMVAGETAHTGLHGANRLASNSLLEALVFADRAARATPEVQCRAPTHLEADVPEWSTGFATDPDENVLVSHAWDETRRLMWNYVGVVRSDRRLERARRRLDGLRQEIGHDYWKYLLTRDLVEVRNIITVAGLIVECALMRQESRGLHYTPDHPEPDDAHWLRDTVLVRGRRH